MRESVSKIKFLPNNPQNLFAGFYPWIISIFFGAVLLDYVYSNITQSALNPSEASILFSEPADFLLLIAVLAMVAAMGAVVASWNVGTARNLFTASMIFLSVESFIPLFFSSIIQNIETSLGLHIGSWIRLTRGALSSILAFAGLWKLYHSRP